MERAVVIVVQNPVPVSIRITGVPKLGISVASGHWQPLPRLHPSPPARSWAHLGNCPQHSSRPRKPAPRRPNHQRLRPHRNVSRVLQSLVWCK